MTQRLVISLLAIIAFGAGFGARMWTERDRALPLPPTMGSEFLQNQAGADKDKKAAPRPVDRVQLLAEIEKLRPQIDAYRTQIDALDAEFGQKFGEILNSEQRALYDSKIADWKKHRAEHEAKAASGPPPPPFSDEEIAKLRQRPFETAFWKISFTGRLEQLTHDYTLDVPQQEKTRELLVNRRTKYIALVDSTPPPTFKLTSLAASVQRLIDPEQPAVAPAK